LLELVVGIHQRDNTMPDAQHRSRFQIFNPGT